MNGGASYAFAALTALAKRATSLPAVRLRARHALAVIAYAFREEDEAGNVRPGRFAGDDLLHDAHRRPHPLRVAGLAEVADGHVARRERLRAGAGDEDGRKC